MTLMGCLGPQGDSRALFFDALQGPLQVTQTDGRATSSSTVRRGTIVLASRRARAIVSGAVGWPRQRGGRMAARRSGRPVRREESPSSSAQGGG